MGPVLEHRAKKWEPVFCENDATTKNASCKKVGTGFLRKRCDHKKRIVQKSGNRFFAKTMRPQKIQTGARIKRCPPFGVAANVAKLSPWAKARRIGTRRMRQMLGSASGQSQTKAGKR
jgi:hypothetical protein